MCQALCGVLCRLLRKTDLVPYPDALDGKVGWRGHRTVSGSQGGLTFSGLNSPTLWCRSAGATAWGCCLNALRTTWPAPFGTGTTKSHTSPRSSPTRESRSSFSTPPGHSCSVSLSPVSHLGLTPHSRSKCSLIWKPLWHSYGAVATRNGELSAVTNPITSHPRQNLQGIELTRESQDTRTIHTASGLLGGSCGLSVDTDVCLFVQMSLFRARERAGSGVNRNSGHGVEARCRDTNSLPGALVPRPTSLSSANSGCLHPSSLSAALAGQSQQSTVRPASTLDWPRGLSLAWTGAEDHP